MSREQTARPPQAHDAAPSEVHSLTPAPAEGAGAALEARITALTLEARQELGARRAEVVGALNALLELLPVEARPDEASAVLHRLLDGGSLDDLEDTEGRPAGVVATRALLALGYPHALEVPPERLEALKRWRAPGVDVPRASITFVTVVTSLIQLGFVTMVDRGFRGITAAMLTGVPEVPTFMDRLRRGVGGLGGTLFLGQLGLTFLVYVLTLAMGAQREWRPLLRRGFLGLAALGAAVGVFQLSLDLSEGWGTLVSAGGALAAGWLLREP